MINRDVDFWDSVATHPAVSAGVFLDMKPTTLAPLIDNPANRPMASENGGIVFIPVDPLRMIWEMHTAYRPDGWGREVARESKRFMAEIFKDASVVVTHEQEGNPQSLPPRSHGWKPAGLYCNVGLSVRLRIWILTRDAWLASPVGRKM